MATDAKISIQDLQLVFGTKKGREAALKLLQEGEEKAGVQKETGATVAVANAELAIQEGEIFVIMGLSGSGKSTLIRCVNRLIEPTRGTIWVDDINVTRADQKQLLELRREKMAMVFQNFGLLPHRSVLDNIAFGLEILGIPKKERETKAREILDQVGLKGNADNMVRELSGGMQQRVGLARALAVDPEILLMDEAFSALDPLIRGQMQDNLLAIQKELHKTILFITHDLDEALKLGDRIAIMRDGRIEQVGSPEDILLNPANDHVKTFVENVEKTSVITATSFTTKASQPSVKPMDSPEEALALMEKQGSDTIACSDHSMRFVGFLYREKVEKAKEEGIQIVDRIIDREVPVTDRKTPVIDLLPLGWKHKKKIAITYGDGKYLGWVSLDQVIAAISEDRTLKQPETQKA